MFFKHILYYGNKHLNMFALLRDLIAIVCNNKLPGNYGIDFHSVYELSCHNYITVHFSDKKNP